MLALEGLTVTAAGRPAPLLRDLSLTVAPGDLLALVGESGSGKTTAGRAILRLLAPGLAATGRILVAGTDMLALPPRALPTIRGGAVGIAFQDPAAALNPTCRIGTQVPEAARRHTGATASAARAEAHRLLAAMGLPDPEAAARAYPHELSGGQRQRALLAAALSGRPGLLIADEPTSGLDTATAAGIMALLAGLRAQGLAVLLITHDLALARAHATHVHVLHEGETLEAAPAAAFFAGPRHPQARALLREHAAPALPAAGGPTVLEATDLAFTPPRRLFGRPPRRIFAGLDFTLHRGECLGVTGPSGAGKTSLARAVLGLAPCEGRLTLEGAPAATRAARRRIQPVFQDPAESLDPRMTVAGILAEPMRLAGAPRTGWRNRSETLLTQVGLDAAFLPRRPATLSGGQAQRVALARALAADPAVLVLDEPTSALDSLNRAQLLTLLADLLHTGLAMLLISHDARVVRALARRTLELPAG